MPRSVEEQKVVALPELRGGLLLHALKKIKEIAGVDGCELENLEDGAQVTIWGPRDNIISCAQLVLRAAVGDFQDIEGVVQIHQEVFGESKLMDASAGQTPLQVIGHLTGCDLTLSGSQLLVQGPSTAVAKGAAKLVERFLADEAKPKDRNGVAAAACGNGVTSKSECVAEIPGLSRGRLLSCRSAVLKKLEETHGVKLKLLDGPEDTARVQICGSLDAMADSESVLWQMSQEDFSAIGFILRRLRLSKADLKVLGQETGKKDKLQHVVSNWREVFDIDLTVGEEADAVQLVLCGEAARVAALRSAICVLLALAERIGSPLNANAKALREIFEELLKHGSDEDLASADSSERGQELLDMLGVRALRLLKGRRLRGTVEESSEGWEMAGEEKYSQDLVLHCKALGSTPLALPKDELNGLRPGKSVSFCLSFDGDRPVATTRPEPQRRAAREAHSAPVIELRIDPLRRQYYWNHTENSSSWLPPPPEIGFWQRLNDERTGRDYYYNPGTHTSLWELPIAKQEGKRRRAPRASRRPPTESAAPSAPAAPACAAAAAVPTASPSQPSATLPLEPRPKVAPSSKPKIPPSRRPQGPRDQETPRPAPSKATESSELDQQTDLDAMIHEAHYEAHYEAVRDQADAAAVPIVEPPEPVELPQEPPAVETMESELDFELDFVPLEQQGQLKEMEVEFETELYDPYNTNTTGEPEELEEPGKPEEAKTEEPLEPEMRQREAPKPAIKAKAERIDLKAPEPLERPERPAGRDEASEGQDVRPPLPRRKKRQREPLEPREAEEGSVPGAPKVPQPPNEPPTWWSEDKRETHEAKECPRTVFAAPQRLHTAPPLREVLMTEPPAPAPPRRPPEPAQAPRTARPPEPHGAPPWQAPPWQAPPLPRQLRVRRVRAEPAVPVAVGAVPRAVRAHEPPEPRERRGAVRLCVKRSPPEFPGPPGPPAQPPPPRHPPPPRVELRPNRKRMTRSWDSRNQQWKYPKNEDGNDGKGSDANDVWSEWWDASWGAPWSD